MLLNLFAGAFDVFTRAVRRAATGDTSRQRYYRKQQEE